MSKAEVRKLIATGKLDKAIEELLAIAEGTAEETTLLLLSGQINQLKSNERIGIITPTAAGIQRNKIAYAVLSTVDEMDDSLFTGNGATSSSSSASDPLPKGPKKMFISYAREDREYVKQLKIAMSPLKRKNLVSTWTDSEILPGSKWREEIKNNMRSSHIILFMVSPDFLNSEFIHEEERPLAIELHNKQGTIIVPIIVRHCMWKHADFKDLNAIPRYRGGDLKPISDWTNKDEAYLTIVEALETLLTAS